MTDDLVFENVRDPSLTPPKPHRSGLAVLSDKRPPLPIGMQPGDSDAVRMLSGEHVTARGRQGMACSSMENGPRGFEVYVRFEDGCRAWIPLDEIAPADATPVEPAGFQVPS